MRVGEESPWPISCMEVRVRDKYCHAHAVHMSRVDIFAGGGARAFSFLSSIFGG